MEKSGGSDGRSDGGLAENPGVVHMGSTQNVPGSSWEFLGVPGSFLSVLLFTRSTQTILER